MGGINKDVHRDYLAKFSTAFHDAVLKLIEKGAKTQKTLTQNELLMEVILTIGIFYSKINFVLFCVERSQLTIFK